MLHVLMIDIEAINYVLWAVFKPFDLHLMSFNIIELLILLHVYSWFYNKINFKKNLNLQGVLSTTNKIQIQTWAYNTM